MTGPTRFERPGGGGLDDLRARLRLVRLLLAERHDPDPFYRALAAHTAARFAFPVEGRLVLDLGCGRGELGRALAAAGAGVVAADLEPDNAAHAHRAGSSVTVADARRLPFPDATFHGVVCSNLLEHTPTPERVLDEIERLVRPGGWAWISWTNWYSPWGGHGITPWQYLGPRLGTRAHLRLVDANARHLPFESVWPTHIGTMLAEVDRRRFRVLDVLARYYPSQRWIPRVPAVREVATWNCLVLLERDPDPMNPVLRRALRRVRQRLGDDPLWLPIVLRATPTGTARRLTDTTQLVIEGFPRSGNTFAVFAVRFAERSAGRPVEISSHVHTPSAVKAAVRSRLPTVVLVRPPLDTLVSLLVAAPHVRPDDAVDEWIHHHRQLWPYRARFVVATFDEVTRHTDVVIARVNDAFGTAFAPRPPTDAITATVFAEIDAHHAALHGGREELAPRPSEVRRRRAAIVRAELERLVAPARLAEATDLYDRFAARATAPD